MHKSPFDYSLCHYDIIDALYEPFKIHVWYPVSHTHYPLIIFSHGLGELYNGISYTWLCQQLASYGYVVVSISHSYANKVINYLASGHNFIKQALIGEREIVRVIEWCEDKKFNTDSIVLMGHSFGGSLSLHLCCNDIRVKAAINLDGPLYNWHTNIYCAKPMLCFIGQLEKPFLPQAFAWSLYMKYQIFPDECTTITLSDCVHEMFSDYAYSLEESLKPFVREPDKLHKEVFHVIDTFLQERLHFFQELS